MNCKTFLDRYLLCDKHDGIPLKIKWHYVHCRACRSAVEKLQAAAAVQQKVLYSSFETSGRLLQQTMAAVYQQESLHRHTATAPKTRASFAPWLAAGILLIIGFILLPMSDSGKHWLTQFGDSFCIPFALLCALSIVAYAAVFFAKNLMFFTEKFMLSDNRTYPQNRPL